MTAPESWRARDLIPRPDPTKLTTEAVDKAAVQYRRELGALRELTEQRLCGMDKAASLAAADLSRLSEHAEGEYAKLSAEITYRLGAEREFIMAQLEIVRSVMKEKFAAVDGQFAASEIAVDAALTAQKEAVGEQNKTNDRAIAKSEAAVKEQLTSLGQVADASFKAVEDKVSDARDRLTSIESLTRGIREAGSEGREQKSMANATFVIILAAISALVSLAALIVTLVLHAHGG